MKSLYLLVVTCLLFVTTTSAQRNYNDSYNRIGLQGGLTIFDIKTDNFNTNSAEGFKAGFTTRGAFYNNFDLIYGLNFYDLNINIKARETVASQERDVEFGIFGVQLNLLASYNIIGQHLSIEAGPALLINSKLTTNEQYENYIIDGYTTLTAKEIEDISKINGVAIVGLTGGFENVRLWAQYQYGFTNILNGLNDENLTETTEDFKGNLSLLAVGVVFYL